MKLFFLNVDAVMNQNLETGQNPLDQFFSSLFELFGAGGQINQGAQLDLITPGLVTLFVPLIFFGLLYYVINRSDFNKWYHWLLMMLLSSSICFGVVAFVMFKQRANFIGGTFSSISWGISSFGISALVFIVASFLGKWWSTQCRNTPF